MDLRFEPSISGSDLSRSSWRPSEAQLPLGAQSNVITAQTRTLVMANIGTVLSMAALAFGAAKLT